MRIAVVCLASRTGGGLTILRDLHRFASKSAGSNQWLFVLSDQDLGESSPSVQLVHSTPHYRGWLSRIRGELTVARRAIEEFDPSVVLSLQNVDTPARGGRPLAIYMHQPLPFVDTRFSMLKRSERNIAFRQVVLGLIIRNSIRRAGVTFVQTSWIADAVRRACPEARVVNVGYTTPEAPAALEVRSEETTGFVYPASAAIYKDHATLHAGVRLWRETCSDPGPVLITLSRETFARVVGGLSDAEADWYEFVGNVSPAQLRDIYARSILVFPSYVETLGLPLYEAQTARCRIVAADTPPSREALERYRAAHFFVPKTPTDLARALGEAWHSRNVIPDPPSPPAGSMGIAGSSWDALLFELTPAK